jgi:transcriptional regulator with XRE-family HTH domain
MERQTTKDACDAEPVEPFMKLLRRHRIAAGFTQTALAAALKLKSPSTVSQWESGASIPSPHLVPMLAQILKLDAMALTMVIEPEGSPTEQARA